MCERSNGRGVRQLQERLKTNKCLKELLLFKNHEEVLRKG